MIGFDATECHRTYGDKGEDPQFSLQYPLRDWGWDRKRCEIEIAAAGLPVPVKSACFMCPASKAHEVHELSANEPEVFDVALRIESTYRNGKHYDKDGPGSSTCHGLGGRKQWAQMNEPHERQRLFWD